MLRGDARRQELLRTGTDDGKGITGAYKKVATALEGGQSKAACALRARVTVERRHGLARAENVARRAENAESEAAEQATAPSPSSSVDAPPSPPPGACFGTASRVRRSGALVVVLDTHSAAAAGSVAALVVL